jgi:hypothetical protein
MSTTTVTSAHGAIPGTSALPDAGMSDDLTE